MTCATDENLGPCHKCGTITDGNLVREDDDGRRWIVGSECERCRDMDKKYQIFCQVDGRLVAFLSMEGELTICHEHFSDEDKFEVTRFIEALDKWQVKRTVNHRSKKGLNRGAFEAIDALQREKPGSVALPQEKPESDASQEGPELVWLE